MTRPTLTAEHVAMLREAIDSHVYWQLSDEHYRNDGAVEDPGSDDEDTAAEIASYRTLAADLAALTTDATCPDCGVTHSAEHQCEPLTTYDDPTRGDR